MDKTCKIYKIVDNTNGDCYIGSTTQKLNYRLSNHKTRCNNVYKCTSYKIINNGDYKIELIEDIGIVSKGDRLQKERYYIENNKCINKVIPGRTRQETCKAYNEKNKEKLKDYHKAYREKSKKYYEKHKEKGKEKFTCECGGKYTRINKLTHEKTKKHIDYLNTIN